MELPPLGVDEELPILKKNRLSTGIRELDIILEGGYFNPGSVLLLGPTAVGKTIFTFHFGAAVKDDVVIFIAADAAPNTIKKKAAEFNLDISGKNVIFIDCYSATLGEVKEGGPFIINGPTALNDLSLAINDVIDKSSGKRLRVIFYSLSAFLLHNSKESMLKFLEVVGGRLKRAGATVLYVVEEGVHDKTLLKTVEMMMDQKLTIIQKEEKKFELDVTGIPVPIQIKLGPSGISIQ